MQMQISQHGERKSTSQFVSDLDAPHFAINSDAEDKSSALSFAFKVLPYGQQYGNDLRLHIHRIRMPHVPLATVAMRCGWMEERMDGGNHNHGGTMGTIPLPLANDVSAVCP